MNLYVLISAETDRQSEERTAADQLGRTRLAIEVLLPSAILREKSWQLKKETMTQNLEKKWMECTQGGKKIPHSIHFQVKM